MAQQLERQRLEEQSIALAQLFEREDQEEEEEQRFRSRTRVVDPDQRVAKRQLTEEELLDLVTRYSRIKMFGQLTKFFIF